MTDDLAGGFQSVDAASDFAVFSDCLTLIDSLPFFAECKRESYDLLGAKPGSRILEIGCGLGDDAASLARLVAPDGSVGVLVAYDNDWETLTVDFADRKLTRTVLNAWCDRFPSGWIGRRLVPLFLQAGLRDVVTRPKTLILRELGVADRLYGFLSTAKRLAEARVISRSDADRWSDALRTADAEGRFFTSYTGFLVSGIRPGGAG
jgi:hypothetical protein